MGPPRRCGAILSLVRSVDREGEPDVAKKVRGTPSTYKPGGQGPTRTNKSSSAAPASGSTDAAAAPVTDIDGAVDAVSLQPTELTISETAPKPAAARRSRRSAKLKADSLDARAAAEDTFVREDLRSIAVITAILVLGLIIAWVLLVPLNLAGLY
jgi:hypothetical protein